MSLAKPIDYQDVAAAVRDEIDLNKIPLKDVLDLIELAVVKSALKETEGNQARAAKLLGIQRSTLIMKKTRLRILEERYGQR